MKVTTLRLHVPAMKAQSDAVDVRGALVNAPGFSNVKFDLLSHNVFVSTASQDLGRDVIRRLTHAGFPPDETVVLRNDQRPG